MLSSKGRSSACQRSCQLLRHEASPLCWRCSEPIVQALHHNDRMAWTADHIVPLAHGGSHDLSNLLPTHRSCNSRGGAAMTNGTPGIGTPPPASRRWR
ncbi:HNH endonuclease [Kitasatospora sp. NPDC088391]|uniref:HNH endonuclease n=1 Tax=Kitasatospora sp. NPDC088391 TaxID=3364074 RepID=UPI00380AA762